MKIEFEITIDDRLIALCRKVFRIKTFVFIIAAGLFAVGLFIFAGEFDVVHTFVPGDVISSAEVNQNFRDLAERTLGTINDVDTSGAVLGNALVYNGVSWAPGASNPTSCKWSDVTGGIGYSGGNVGIGTTSPGQKLHINGGAGTANIYIQSSLQAALYLGDMATSIYTTASTNDIRFLAGSADRMVIDNTGNVGIGTTSPGAKLDINGTLYASGGISGPLKPSNLQCYNYYELALNGYQVLPAGMYNYCSGPQGNLPDIEYAFYPSGVLNWFPSGSQANGKGCVFSDGTNVRIRNTSGSPAYFWFQSFN